MPIIKSAIKKLRADRKKTALNKVVKTRAMGLMTAFRKEVKGESLAGVFSAIDKAAKNKIFHRKKADRLKSRLAKLLAGKR